MMQELHMKMRGPHMKILGPHMRTLVHGRQARGLHMRVDGGRRKEEPHSLCPFPHWEQQGGIGRGGGKSKGGGGGHLEVSGEDVDQCEVKCAEC